MWIETTSTTRQEETSAKVEEAWTLETDSLRIVIQCRLQRKMPIDDFYPNWILRCFGSLIINYDLNTASLEIAKIRSIEYLRKKIKYLSLELEEPIEISPVWW